MIYNNNNFFDFVDGNLLYLIQESENTKIRISLILQNKNKLINLEIYKNLKIVKQNKVLKIRI